MHHPTDRIAHTPVMEHWLEREIAQWVHPMKDRSGDPSHHERTLSILRTLSDQDIASLDGGICSSVGMCSYWQYLVELSLLDQLVSAWTPKLRVCGSNPFSGGSF